MDSKGPNLPEHPIGNLSWYEEFELIPRFPRPPIRQIAELIESIKEPKIFLALGDQNVDIVIRMPVGPGSSLLQLTQALEKFDVTLPGAFADILWRKLQANGSTTWAELSRIGIQAFCLAWNQWAELQYLGHFHPAADEMFKRIKEQIDSASKKQKRGRNPVTLAELSSLQERYQQLLAKCVLVHEAAITAVTSARTKNNEAMARKEIRRAIWDSVRLSIHGRPGDGYIFGGQAFKRIATKLERKSGKRGRRKPELHDPTTWTPRQLAISLLSLERSQAYDTTEKKLAKATRRKRSGIETDAKNEPILGVQSE